MGVKAMAGITLAAGLFLGCTPLSAAEHLDCALALRSAAVDVTVFEQYRAGKNIGEVLVAQRGDGLKACAAANKWSAGATEAAVRVLFGGILASGVAKELGQLNLPVDRLTAALAGFVAGLGNDDRRKLADGEIADVALDPLFAMLADQAILTEAQLNSEMGSKVGEYLSAYANLAVFRERFKTQ